MINVTNYVVRIKFNKIIEICIDSNVCLKIFKTEILMGYLT